MNLTLSKKQYNLIDDITNTTTKEIYVLGSTQSGKTYSICFGMLEYARKLYEYDSKTEYKAAIIGWAFDTMQRNIVDVMIAFLKDMGFKEDINYVLKYGQKEHYLKIYNIVFYFFTFNNQLSFNKILGGGFILVWVDESARIYTQEQLRKPFDEMPGRRLAFVGHPYMKTVHSFNVEGNENHPYKQTYINGKINARHYTFYPYDNPQIKTEEQMQEVLELFPPGSLRDQKIFCKWVVSEGLVFNEINVIHDLKDYVIREIGIGSDYGSVNQTCFIPIALAYNNKKSRWELIRLQCYYHDPRVWFTNPTTEYFSKQLRLFIAYLKRQYNNVPITELVIDSEAAHFSNRLTTDGIKHETSIKGDGSVTEGVQYLQSLFYKQYFYILESDSIYHINDDGTVLLCNKDESLTEYRSYQYDLNTTLEKGYDCYKKENEDSIDATRYILQEWRIQNKAPTV